MLAAAALGALGGQLAEIRAAKRPRTSRRATAASAFVGHGVWLCTLPSGSGGYVPAQTHTHDPSPTRVPFCIIFSNLSLLDLAASPRDSPSATV